MDYKNQTYKLKYLSVCFILKVDLFGLFHSFTYSSDKYLLSEHQITFRGDQRKLNLKGEDPKEGIDQKKRSTLRNDRELSHIRHV